VTRHCIALAVALISLPAGAQPAKPPPPLVNATEVQSFGAPIGFVDDAIAFDDQRLAYVVADGSTKTELHIAQPNTPEVVTDLSPVTLHPIALKLLGARTFVVGLDANNDQIGALLDKGKVAWKIGPATHITVITREGAQRVAIDRVTGTRHEVELVSLDNGKRVAAGHAFESDGKALDFHLNHWSDGWTKAYGIKGGDWDRKENQRTADVEATYDLVTGKFSDRHPIQDLFEQRKRYQVLADANGSLDFVRMSWDNTGVVAWRAGKALPLDLDQPLAQYDPKSLQGEIEPDGTVWIALKVDPVNPDAVARKKADAEYLDIFKAGADGKAVRMMRILATGVRYRFGVIKDKVWLLERSSGFDRGGKALTFYTINAAPSPKSN
jgi:hypothetical protein